MTHLIDKDAAVAEIERTQKVLNLDDLGGRSVMAWCEGFKRFLDTLEVKEVDFERELSKYVSNGIHRFFPNVNDDYCKMDSVIWQDYVIETAKHFYELGLKAQKGK